MLLGQAHTVQVVIATTLPPDDTIDCIYATANQPIMAASAGRIRDQKHNL